MPKRSVRTRRIGCGVGTGIASTPCRCTIHSPIIIRTTDTPAPTTEGLSVGDFPAGLLAADFGEAADISAADFAGAVDRSGVVFVVAGHLAVVGHFMVAADMAAGMEEGDSGVAKRGMRNP